MLNEQDAETSALASDLEEAGFVAPRYNGQCICNLPDTFARLLGLKSQRPIEQRDFYDFVGESQIDNVIFLLLDGLGLNSIQRAREARLIPSFERLAQHSKMFSLTSVFPSTTSTATTSLHTGLTPQEHGIIGYTMYMNEIGAIAQMLDLAPIFGRRSLFDMGFDPASFLGRKTIHERFSESGVPSHLYINKYIVGSGLSQITNRGANVIPILTASDLFSRLRKNLESSASTSSSRSPSFHFAYYASPDTIAHSRGPFSDEYAAEVESLCHMLNWELFEKLDRVVARNTLLLISADHGLSHIEENNIIDISHHEGLLKMLKVPPTGDSRCLILHAKSETYLPEIGDFFEKNFQDRFQILDSKDALRQGLFGTGAVKDQVRDRIGDLIVLPKGPTAVDNSNVQPRNDYVPGRHGGLSREEMIVPLIASRLG